MISIINCRTLKRCFSLWDQGFSTWREFIAYRVDYYFSSTAYAKPALLLGLTFLLVVTGVCGIPERLASFIFYFRRYFSGLPLRLTPRSDRRCGLPGRLWPLQAPTPRRSLAMTGMVKGTCPGVRVITNCLRRGGFGLVRGGGGSARKLT